MRVVARRAVFLAVIALQLLLVIRAYDADHAFFGFQMFPETSEWRAEIIRIDDAGAEFDVRNPWPGGYEWADLVRGRGLTTPWVRHPADAGIRSTLHFLDEALDWVARNTAQDTETVRLEARITYWQNGRGPLTATLVSRTR